MPTISKEQVFAIGRGLLVQKLGASTTQKFNGISPTRLLNPGFSDSTTSNLTLNNASVTVTSTSNYKPGMLITKASGAGAFFNGSPLCVFSITTGTTFVVGNYAEKLFENVTATLETTNNVVTITSSHTTERMFPGLKVTRTNTTGGAFNATGPFIKEITGPKTFTLVTSIDSSSVPGNTAANHGTAGDVTFYIGGIQRNHNTIGAITFIVGGIDPANGEIFGLGDINPGVYTLATGSSTIGGEVVAKAGGDINGNGGLANIERDYHFTGQCLIRKLK